MRTRLILLLSILGIAACRSRDADGPLFPAPLSGGWGFIDASGGEVVPGRYQNARGFSEGLGAVSINGRWGYVDRMGQVVIPALHRLAGEFHGGVAIVDSGLPERPYGLIDSSGAWVTEPTFRSLAPGDETGEHFLGTSAAGQGFTFFDKRGQFKFGPFEMAFAFHQGYARVQTQNRDGWIDVNGQFTPTPDGVALDAIRFSENKIAARRDKMLGYINPQGVFLIEPLYDQGGEFRDGLAPVAINGRWQLITSTGGVAAMMPENVRHAGPLSEGRSLVTADRNVPGRKLGYIGRDGQWAIDPVWDDAADFQDGLALVGDWRTNSIAYINPEGKFIWKGSAP